MARNKNMRGGSVYLRANDQRFEAKGNFRYNIGHPKREAVVGLDGVHGFTEKPQANYIEGEITKRDAEQFQTLLDLENETLTLEEANGDTVMLREAWFAGDGEVNPEEGMVSVRFEGMSAEIVGA